MRTTVRSVDHIPGWVALSSRLEGPAAPADHRGRPQRTDARWCTQGATSVAVRGVGLARVPRVFMAGFEAHQVGTAAIQPVDEATSAQR